MRKKFFGLKESLEKGHLVLLGDSMVRGALQRANPLGFNGICDWHTVGRIISNATTKFLPMFDDEAKLKWPVRMSEFLLNYHNFNFKNIRAFCQLAKTELTNKELAKLPSTTARSINIYFKDIDLSRDDRFQICRVLKPNGWKLSFNDRDAQLSEEENELREKLLNAVKKFPTIKVSSLRKSLLKL